MIVVNLDVMMARRKMSLGELSERVGITLANLSILKTARLRQCDCQRSMPSAVPLIVLLATYLSIAQTIMNENVMFINCE